MQNAPRGAKFTSNSRSRCPWPGTYVNTVLSKKRHLLASLNATVAYQVEEQGMPRTRRYRDNFFFFVFLACRGLKLLVVKIFFLHNISRATSIYLFHNGIFASQITRKFLTVMASLQKDIQNTSVMYG